MHPSKVDPSRLHLKVEPAFEDEKVKVAEVLATVPTGPEPMVVSDAAAVVKVQLLFAPRALPLASLTPELPPTTITW